MSTFLRSLAEELMAAHGKELRDVAVVLPSQRAGLYLRKHLADVAGSALWSPQVFTFSPFLEKLSGIRVAEPMEMLFALYHLHRSRTGDGADTFTEFLQWAPTTLGDMSEADAHLVDLDRYYKDLRMLEDVEQWSLRLGEDPLSAGQKRLVRYWETKGVLHRSLVLHLAERGLGMEGSVQRAAVQRLRGGTGELPWSTVWFAGANALTKAQEEVLKEMGRLGKARSAWDADRFYLDDPAQEAGTSLRRMIAVHGNGSVAIGNGLLELPRRIVATTVPNAIAQVYHAAALAAGLSLEERSRTAIVLADENLLMPLLGALPDDIGPLNVTMGLPLRALPVFGVVDALLRAHTGRRERMGYHHADLEALLLHPFLRTNDPATDARSLIEALRVEGLVFVPAERLLKWEEEHRGRAIALRMLDPVGDPSKDLPERVIALIKEAQRCMAGDVFAQEQLFHVARVSKKLGELLQRHPESLDITACTRLWQRLLREERIGLFGEPLTGLQIMGMLETRSVDHDRLIILGANEGMLPPSSADRSFVPMDVRRVFRLPLPHDGEAVSAYHFLRSVQRAKDVVLVHAALAEQGPAEPTRYIAQLEHDLVPRSHTTLEHSTIQVGSAVRTVGSVGVQKTAAVRNSLKSLFEKGLSPSALGTFLRCPLDFHHRYILQLKEPEDVDERVGADRLGNAVHQALQRLYAPLLNSNIEPVALRVRAELLPAFMHDAMLEELPTSALGTGQPLLRIRMATKAVQRFVDMEAGSITEGHSIVPRALESPFAQNLQISGVEDIPSVRIHGVMDRVDELDDEIRIVDYKTGKVDAGKLHLKAPINDSVTAKHGYALQLLVYAWAYLTEHPHMSGVTAAIVPLRHLTDLDDCGLSIAKNRTITRADLPAIEELLRSIVLRMLDPEVPFTHDPDSIYCAFCIQ